LHLLYADESGNVADPNQRFFVLSGFSTFERNGFWLSSHLDRIASRFDPANPNSIELHGNPMLGGKGIWHRIPLQERIDAIQEALEVFAGSNSSNRIFACVVLKTAAPKDIVEYAFEQLSSRFDQYLMRLFRKNDTQRGLIIFDKSTYESTLQSLATDFRTIGHRWGVLRNLSEVPLFLNSKASRLIQLADLISYAIFRNFERQDSRFYSIIQNRFDSEGGIIHGLHLKIS